MLLYEIAQFIRAFIGFILLLSGVGKLLDPAGTKQGIDEYGVPARWRGFVAQVLPYLELAIGVGLILQIVSLIFIVGSLIVFSIFVLGVGRVLARGTAMDCHCFGALARERVSRATFIRLIILIGMACLVLGADAVGLQKYGFTFIAPGIGSWSTCIPAAIAASIGVASILLLRQVILMLRTMPSTERL